VSREASARPRFLLSAFIVVGRPPRWVGVLAISKALPMHEATITIWRMERSGAFRRAVSSAAIPSPGLKVTARR
jgi:hypothetical protein